MFSIKQMYCLHTYRQITSSVHHSKLNSHQMSFSMWRYGSSSGKILCAKKHRHTIPMFHTPQSSRTLHHETSRRTFSWKWSTGTHIHKAVFLVGAALVGGIALKSMNVFAADDNADVITSTNNNVNATEEFYTGGKISYNEAVGRAQAIVERKKVETGSPGISVAVSVDGKTVWAQGFGYADVENLTPCTPETVLRIASISKPIAMVTVAKQVEAGKLDLDAPVQRYVPEFPEKTWDNKKVEITTRQLLCHLSGIRDYKKDYFQKKKTDSENSTNTSLPAEFLISKNYTSVVEGLELFKDDPLVHAPGSKFLYTSHGWTLISAIVEKVATEHKDFVTYLTKVLGELGLENTYPEYQSPLVPNRGRYYIKNDKGRIINAPFVDLSYKWAGGGLISTVLDVVKFGNAMLYSYQADTPSQENTLGDSKRKQGYLRSETMKMMWTPVEKSKYRWEGISNTCYGLGWSIHFIKDPKPFCKNQKFYVSHTGGAIGASSVLLILPTIDNNNTSSKQEVEVNEIQPRGVVVAKDNQPHGVVFAKDNQPRGVVAKDNQPRGVVVAIIANMLSVGLTNTAYDIAELFERVQQ